MNIGKFTSLYDLLEAFPTEESCIKYLEQQRLANSIPVSPYDPTSKVYNRGDGMYRCKNTGKNFNVRIGTMFEGSKLPLRKWFVAIYEITSRKKGISSIELSKRISVTYKTAWFMNQRIRECFGIVMEEKLDGEVELDETFVGGKNKNWHYNKKVKKCLRIIKVNDASSISEYQIKKDWIDNYQKALQSMELFLNHPLDENQEDAINSIRISLETFIKLKFCCFIPDPDQTFGTIVRNLQESEKELTSEEAQNYVRMTYDLL